MLAKTKGYWLVISRVVLYKFGKHVADDFWGWLYLRVCNPKSRDYENQTFVWLLLADALDAKEHLRAVAMYRNFQDIIDRKATPKYKKLIVESIEAAERLNQAKAEPKLIIER